MDPATAGALTALLKEGGPWGIVALLILSNIWSAKGWMACYEARITDAKHVTEETVSCITNSSQHISVSAIAITQLTATTEQRLRATELLTASVDRQGSDIRDLRDEVRGRR